MKNASQVERSAEAMAGVPIYVSRHDRLPDDSYPIRTVTLSNVREPDESTMHMVVGHGAWGGPTSMGPLLKHVLRTAGTEGRSATATLYSDPWFGFGRYAQADRAARYAKVTQATADRVERPVIMVPHSWSVASSLETARQAYGAKQASALVAYTPANRIEEGKLAFGSFVGRSLRELKRGNSVAGPRSLLAICAVGAGIAMHGLPAVRTATRECTEAFNTRLTDELADLSRPAEDEAGWPGMPTGVVLAQWDEFFGYGEASKRHLRDAGFVGAVGMIGGATHTGAVSNFKNGTALYSVLDAVVRPGASGNDAYYV